MCPSTCKSLKGIASTLCIFCIALLAVIDAHPARADVAFVEELKVRRAEGSATIVRDVHISGPRKREDSTMAFSSSLAEQVGVRRQETYTVTRLDEGLSWTLDPESRTFARESFDSLEAEMRLKALQADSTASTAEAPDANPRVTITSGSETRQIGPWRAHRTTVEVSTEVVDLRNGLKRPGTIVWDLWLVDALPGTLEIRSFDRMESKRLGTPSEIAPLQAIGKSFPKSVKQAMLALSEVHGDPVAWTWIVRTALSPEERAALAESSALQREGLDEPSTSNDSSNEPDNTLIDPLRDTEQHERRSHEDRSLHRPGEEEPVGAAEATSVDMNADAGEGRTVLVRIDSTLKSISTAACDPSLFEIPADYKDVGQ